MTFLNAYQWHRGIGCRAGYALQAARAEIEAQRRGWHVEWEDEPEGAHDFDGAGDECPENRRLIHEHGGPPRHGGTWCEHENLCAVLKDADGAVLASLGGIVDPDRGFMRTVEADLYMEALAEVRERERTALPRAVAALEAAATAVLATLGEGGAAKCTHPELFSASSALNGCAASLARAAVEIDAAAGGWSDRTMAKSVAARVRAVRKALGYTYP